MLGRHIRTMLYEDRGSNQTDAVTSPGTPTIADHHQQVRRGKEICHPESEKESRHLISDF